MSAVQVGRNNGATERGSHAKKPGPSGRKNTPNRWSSFCTAASPAYFRERAVSSRTVGHEEVLSSSLGVHTKY